MLKVCAYDVRKAPIRDLLISIHKTRDFEWQTAHTKGCQENRCELLREIISIEHEISTWTLWPVSGRKEGLNFLSETFCNCFIKNDSWKRKKSVIRQ